MPPACRLNAKQAQDEETRLGLESDEVLRAHQGMLMSTAVQK